MNEKQIKINGATVTATKEQLEEALAEFDKHVGGLVWIPKDGEEYYIVSAPSVLDFTWEDNYIDHNRLVNNSVFETKAEAEAKLKRDQAKYEVLKYMAENFKPFVPDWGVEDQVKSCIKYSHYSKRLEVHSVYSVEILYELPYMSNNEQADRLIRAQKENLLIMFGVE